MKLIDILQVIPDSIFSCFDIMIDREMSNRKKFYLVMFAELNVQHKSFKEVDILLKNSEFKFNIRNNKFSLRKEKFALFDIDELAKVFQILFEAYHQYLSSRNYLSNFSKDSINIVGQLLNSNIHGYNGKNIKGNPLNVAFMRYAFRSKSFLELINTSSKEYNLKQLHHSLKLSSDEILLFEIGEQCRLYYSEPVIENCTFILRTADNINYRVIDTQIGFNSVQRKNGLVIESDARVKLFNRSNQETESIFRVIKILDSKQTFFLITNDYVSSAIKIVDLYINRRTIEKIFIFLNQYITFTELMGVSKEMSVPRIYLSMILDIILVTYKKTNSIKEYKRTRQKVAFELAELILNEGLDV